MAKAGAGKRQMAAVRRKRNNAAKSTMKKSIKGTKGFLKALMKAFK